MNISLPPEQEKLIQEKVANGLYSSASELISVALNLLIEREQTDRTRLQELRREIAIGLEQADKGDLVEGEIVFERLRKRNRDFINSNS